MRNDGTVMCPKCKHPIGDVYKVDGDGFRVHKSCKARNLMIVGVRDGKPFLSGRLMEFEVDTIEIVEDLASKGYSVEIRMMTSAECVAMLKEMGL